MPLTWLCRAGQCLNDHIAGAVSTAIAATARTTHELTRQYNEGYKTDLAEPHAGPGGCDDVNEIKLWTPLLKTSSPGVGNASSGGTPASVGHSYAFGNTEEKARRLNMGCKARGQPSQLFSHKTGHGYVRTVVGAPRDPPCGGLRRLQVGRSGLCIAHLAKGRGKYRSLLFRGSL